MDFHVGINVPSGTIAGAREDWFVSGVYVEQDEITTSVAGPPSKAEGTGTS